MIVLYQYEPGVQEFEDVVGRLRVFFIGSSQQSFYFGAGRDRVSRFGSCHVVPKGRPINLHALYCLFHFYFVLDGGEQLIFRRFEGKLSVIGSMLV